MELCTTSFKKLSENSSMTDFKMLSRCQKHEKNIVSQPKDYIACVYESRWWLGEVTGVNRNKEDCCVLSLSSIQQGQQRLFCKSINDSACVLFTNFEF
ncbi:hypothetical protein PR048_006699 [Dryococelus australis]|uniref:Uncharacterized protein n=1 Tax=Dryococelus australis TaxID=614101 RepID=A0ABQ9IBP1_9NEOP|nr:hypothetical protein PR048_006699 [Dryococelus australis]